MAYSVYVIENIANGKMYVGATTRPGERRRKHFAALRRSHGVNALLQADFDKYGQDTFVFRVIAQTTYPCTKQLRALEEQCISQLAPAYNVNLKPAEIPTTKPRGAQWAPIMVEWGEHRVSLSALAVEHNVDKRKARKRFTRGWPLEQCLEIAKRVRTRKRKQPIEKEPPQGAVEYDGIVASKTKHLARYCVSEATQKRLRAQGLDWVGMIEYAKAGGWKGELERNKKAKAEEKQNRKRAEYMKKERFEHDGKSLTVDQWAAITGVNRQTIYQRVKVLKWTVAQALGFDKSPSQLKAEETAAKKSAAPKRPRGRPRKNTTPTT